MLAVLAALLVAQTQATPAATPFVATPAPAAASAVPGAAASPLTPQGRLPGDDAGTIRRGPETSPRMLPPVPAGAVRFTNSGSTNTSGYVLTIEPDGAATIAQNGTTRTATVAAPQARWLFLKVRAAGPLGELGRGGCMKSASFGTVERIEAGGASSADLSCGPSPQAVEILRTIGVIRQQLGITTGRRLRFMR